MSDVNAADRRIINGPEDVYPLYRGAGADVRTGVEVELAFFKANDLAPIGVTENENLRAQAHEALGKGVWVHNEPTSETVEVSSIAAPLDDLRAVMDDVTNKIKIVMQVAERNGLKRSYFQELPERTADDLLSRIVNVERYHAFFKPYRSDMRGFAEYFSVCKSNQVSVSYSTPEHMFKNVRRLYLLAPFLFLLTDNSTGFSQGRPFGGHGGMTLRHKGLKEGRGGVPPYVLSARSGEEYLASHIDHVMNNPLYVYYDQDGKIVRLPAGTWTSFNELKQKGLNTATNYFFAQTVLWPDVKIAALRDADGEVSGHRYEARMFGVGLHQHRTALMITGMLARDEALGAAVDALLKSFGLDPEGGPATQVELDKAYQAARSHGGAFFDIPFGSGTMRAFAQRFADLFEPVLDAAGFGAEGVPMITICRTGCTDGKVNRAVFLTLEDVLDFQMNYDMALFSREDACAKIVFADEMNSGSAKRSRAVAACCGS
ncbi:MAG: hypothetical protein KJ017_08270 [Alphaproteobacteria bacterium]|nr:hypothetical protein [Alphaproteobacteria bacterium]